MEASLNRLLWNRSISPTSLLETSISEEVRPHDLEEEEEAGRSPGPMGLPTTASRRHTLAEVSAGFHRCSPPCEYSLTGAGAFVPMSCHDALALLELLYFLPLQASWSVLQTVPLLTAV